jgi:hypothetical protein
VRAGRALLLAALVVAPVVAPAPVAMGQTGRRVFVATARDITLVEALEHPAIGQIAKAGGVGLLVGERRGFLDSVRRGSDPVTAVPVLALLSAVRFEGRGGEALVVVVGTPRNGPDWVALASGTPHHILTGPGPPRGLTSGTTRTDGVVTRGDVQTTIRAYLGYRPAALFGSGSAITIEGEAPTDLAARARDFRRVAIPVGLTVLAIALGSLIIALLVLLVAPGLTLVRHSVAVLGLFGMALAVALIPASVLPSLEPVVLIPGVLLLGGLLFGAALWAGRRDHALAVAVVAGVGLAVLVVDAALGWPTEVTPLLGGGALLGVRFYGLGNAAAGIVLAGAVLLAARIGPWLGVAILAAAGLFAGLPFLGSDLGGGVTAFAMAGVWYGWRVRGRFDALTAGAGLGAAVLGAAVLVAAHALWPTTTHVARAVEGPGPGLASTFLDRFAANVRRTTAIWPVWLTVIGLPAWIAVAARRVGRFQEALLRRPARRMAVIVLAIGGIIGFVVNDSYGTAAMTFAFVSTAMTYPALRDRWTTG